MQEGEYTMENNQINCTTVKEILSLYIDNRLDDSQGEAVTRHLAVCEDCKREYEELCLVSELLGEVEELPLPAVFDERLHAALKVKNLEITREFKPVPTTIKQKTVMWKKISSLVAVFVIGIFGIVLYNNIDSPLNGNELNNLQSNIVLYDDAAGTTAGALESKEDLNASDVQGTEGESDNVLKNKQKDTATPQADAVASQPVTLTQDISPQEDSQFADSTVSEKITFTEMPEKMELPDLPPNNPRRHLDQIGTNAAIGSCEYGELSTCGDGITDIRDYVIVNAFVWLLEKELSKIDFKSQIVNYEKVEGLWHFDIEVYTFDETGNEVIEKYTYIGEGGILWRKD